MFTVERFCDGNPSLRAPVSVVTFCYAIVCRTVGTQREMAHTRHTLLTWVTWKVCVARGVGLKGLEASICVCVWATHYYILGHPQCVSQPPASNAQLSLSLSGLFPPKKNYICAHAPHHAPPPPEGVFQRRDTTITRLSNYEMIRSAFAERHPLVKVANNSSFVRATVVLMYFVILIMGQIFQWNYTHSFWTCEKRGVRTDD